VDIQQNMRDVSRLRKIIKERSKEDNLVRYKERLKRSIERKFRTTFIGALHAFESQFGAEWGGREPVETLTERQFKLRRLWDKARTEVLNKGNDQLRAALAEIDEYTVEWNRHVINIPVQSVKEIS
jgi:hypothetical protein